MLALLRLLRLLRLLLLLGVVDGRTHGCDKDCVCDGVDLSRLKGQMWKMPEVVGDPEGKEVHSASLCLCLWSSRPSVCPSVCLSVCLSVCVSLLAIRKGRRYGTIYA